MENLRVALVNAGFEKGQEDVIVSPPLGIMCVGAALKREGYEVALLDWSGMDLDEEWRKSLESFHPDIVGFTVVMGTSILRSIEISRWCKGKGMKVVWGGAFPSVLPEMVLRDAPVDFVVIGEGEQTMLELVRTVASGGDPKNISGLAFMSGKTLIRTAARTRIPDLDQLPMPMWEELGDLSKYLIEYHRRKAIPMVTSRGCPGTCAFCYTKSMWGYRWTARSAEKVVSEIQMIMKLNPRITAFIFDDDLFAGDPKRIIGFCDLLTSQGMDIKWNCEIRAKDITRELVKKMKGAGCEELLLGVESGSQRMLDKLCKGVRVEKIVEAFEIAHQEGIKAIAMLMVGLPGETMEDFQATDDLLRKIAADGFYFSLYIPSPGTAFLEESKRFGFDEPTDLKGWAGMGAFNVNVYEARSLSKVPKAKVDAMIRRELRRVRRSQNWIAFRNDPAGAMARTMRRISGKK
ncbi:MAG: B12-binding domain-containing radical SAM protein [Methanomassiliicoccales archaeon]|nr:B12-binding domain-containing radical SAM protein [Methanomassiliicoccales archaeon]